MAKKSNKPVAEKTMAFFLAWEKHGFDIDKKNDAALEAGYSLGNLSARATEAIQNMSGNEMMQTAMKDKGLNYDLIASKLLKKLNCKQPFTDKGNDNKTIFVDDNYVQMKALEFSARLADALPSTKVDINERKLIEIHITQETVDRGQKAIDMGVTEIDSIESEFIE